MIKLSDALLTIKNPKQTAKADSKLELMRSLLLKNKNCCRYISLKNNLGNRFKEYIPIFFFFMFT